VQEHLLAATQVQGVQEDIQVLPQEVKEVIQAQELQVVTLVAHQEVIQGLVLPQEVKEVIQGLALLQEDQEVIQGLALLQGVQGVILLAPEVIPAPSLL